MSYRERAMEAEQALCGAAMLNGEWLTETDLCAGDFLNEKNRIVWESIEGIHSRNEPVDMVTVSADLQSRGFKWDVYLSELCRNTPSAANWHGYVQALKRHGRKAKAFDILTEAMQALHDSDGAVDETISRLMAIDSVERNYDKGPRDFVKEALDNIEARKNGEIHALTTGVELLDQFLGGFHDSDLIVVGARPAMGKTAVMLNFAVAANAPVGIISGEQGADQVGERLFSMTGSVPVQSMRRADLKPAEWDALSKAATRLIKQEYIFLNDHPAPDLSRIQKQARKWKHQRGIKALFVDYIQRIKGGDPKAPKHERIGDVVRGLKSLARELDIPVIALAQVSRACELREDKRPSMADLADSSEIEKEADQIITLYRDEQYNDRTDDAGIIEFRICKNRHGEVNFVRAAWRGEYMQVRNLAREVA